MGRCGARAAKAAAASPARRRRARRRPSACSSERAGSIVEAAEQQRIAGAVGSAAPGAARHDPGADYGGRECQVELARHVGAGGDARDRGLASVDAKRRERLGRVPRGAAKEQRGGGQERGQVGRHGDFPKGGRPPTLGKNRAHRCAASHTTGARLPWMANGYRAFTPAPKHCHGRHGSYRSDRHDRAARRVKSHGRFVTDRGSAFRRASEQDRSAGRGGPCSTGAHGQRDRAAWPYRLDRRATLGGHSPDHGCTAPKAAAAGCRPLAGHGSALTFGARLPKAVPRLS